MRGFENQIQTLIMLLRLLINRPYRWGGADPERGFDCSGLVVECLTSIGRLERGTDLTADGLYREFGIKQQFKCDAPGPGVLVFWRNEQGMAYHVAICVDYDYCVTADGGDRTVLTHQNALDKDARIRLLPIDHRSKKPEFVNIFQEAK